MNPKLVIFGGTGGLGRLVSPLLEKDFDVLSLGTAFIDVRNEKLVEDFFDNEGHIPYIIYMSVGNCDSVLHKLKKDKVNFQIETNVKGFLNVLRYCLPLMREAKFGRILYMSSILSERPIPGTGIYSATKAFNDNIIRTCALENAKYNITCNSLQLGYFNAGLTTQVPKDILSKVLDKIPARRLGNAEDLEKAVRFVIDSPYLNGVNLDLSGGLALM